VPPLDVYIALIWYNEISVKEFGFLNPEIAAENYTPETKLRENYRPEETEVQVGHDACARYGPVIKIVHAAHVTDGVTVSVSRLTGPSLPPLSEVSAALAELGVS
jgi:hypothetical protein